MGIYPLLIGALADFVKGLRAFSLAGEAIWLLGNFAFGVVVGLLLFAHVVDYLFRHFPDLTVALMVGFMVGAIRPVWPFWYCERSLAPPQGEHSCLKALTPYFPEVNSSLFWEALLLTLFGFALVFALEWLAAAGHLQRAEED